jgi:hypothetical protein|tara:strand:+ start:92 stop:277 length:186 start_codon:yes stop_codon:yes gene_type:complete
MACKKSELVSAINSFGAARSTGDGNLVAFSGRLIGELLESLTFDPEDESTPEEEASDNQPE